jgi:hypothetical protein
VHTLNHHASPRVALSTAARADRPWAGKPAIAERADIVVQTVTYKRQDALAPNGLSMLKRWRRQIEQEARSGVDLPAIQITASPFLLESGVRVTRCIASGI